MPAVLDRAEPLVVRRDGDLPAAAWERSTLISTTPAVTLS